MQRLQENARILSRFQWITDPAYKKWMVAVLIFLILLLAFRFPIIRLISDTEISVHPHTNDDNGNKCMLDGSLKIESIRLIPGPTCHSVKVLFSMNTKGKGHVTVNYGPSKDLEFQSSAADLKVPVHSSNTTLTYTAHLTILKPGSVYYYKIACGTVQSQVHQFKSWKAGSHWSPTVTLFPTSCSHFGNTSRTDSSLLIQFSDWPWLSMTSKEKELAASIPNVIMRDDAVEIMSIGRTTEKTTYKDLFYTTVGPMQLFAVNVTALFGSDSSGMWRELTQRLQRSAYVRSQKPWVVFVTYGPGQCEPSTTGRLTPCNRLVKLLRNFRVDSYLVAGMYFRTQLRGSHNGSLPGPMWVSLRGDGTQSVKDQRMGSDKLKAIAIEADSRYQLCVTSIDCQSGIVINRHCVKGSAAMFIPVDYDKTVWLILVIILSAVFLGVIVTRKCLYERLCRYMNSYGGPPLLHGKLLPM